MLIFSRNGNDGRSRIMACHSHHRHLTQARFFCNVETQFAHNFAWLNSIGDMVFGESYRSHQRRLKLLCLGVHQA